MLRQLEKYGAPDTLVPVDLDNFESVKRKILWLRDKFGFKRFCLEGLVKGHRSIGYPKREDYYEAAKNSPKRGNGSNRRGFPSAGFAALR